MGDERLEEVRTIPGTAAEIFAVLTDPQGHVAIDSSGMLQSAAGSAVTAVGDAFVVHMDREALGDLPLGHYDVTVIITTFVADEEIAWTIEGVMKPPLRHIYGYRLAAGPEPGTTVVTSYYDWSEIAPEYRGKGIFPVIAGSALKATLGILERTVRSRAAA